MTEINKARRPSKSEITRAAEKLEAVMQKLAIIAHNSPDLTPETRTIARMVHTNLEEIAALINVNWPGPV